MGGVELNYKLRLTIKWLEHCLESGMEESRNELIFRFSPHGINLKIEEEWIESEAGKDRVKPLLETSGQASDRRMQLKVQHFTADGWRPVHRAVYLYCIALCYPEWTQKWMASNPD